MRKSFALMVTAALMVSACAQMPSAVSGEERETQQTADAFATYLSARFAAGEHDMSQAARYYGNTLKNDPANADLLSLAFFYATTSGDMDQAGKYAGQIIAKTPDDINARLALAALGFKHKNYAGVRKTLFGNDKGPFTQLVISLFDGWAAAGLGDAAGVAADMKTLNAQGGAEGLDAFHAALIADYMNSKDADAAYKKALPLNATSPRMQDAYGNFLERQGRVDDARDFYKKQEGNLALAPVMNAGLARIAADRKPQALIMSPADGAAEGLFSIAASLNDANSANISILYLRMALYLKPDLALASILLADRFEALKKYDDAVAIYRTVDKSSLYYRMAATQAAINETRLDKKTAAIETLRALTQDFPNNAENWIALGDALRDDNSSAAAINAYDRAAGLLGAPAKRDWPFFYARAMAKEKSAKWDSAEADINTALKLSPDQPELLNYLGYSWVDQGRRIPEALAMLEKARSLRPYDGYIMDSVGWAYYRLDRFDKAAQTLGAAVLLVPGDPTINDHLGDALWKNGRRMEARFQWNHALTFTTADAEKGSIEKKLKTGLAG